MGKSKHFVIIGKKKYILTVDGKYTERRLVDLVDHLIRWQKRKKQSIAKKENKQQPKIDIDRIIENQRNLEHLRKIEEINKIKEEERREYERLENLKNQLVPLQQHHTYPQHEEHMLPLQQIEHHQDELETHEEAQEEQPQEPIIQTAKRKHYK